MAFPRLKQFASIKGWRIEGNIAYGDSSKDYYMVYSVPLNTDLTTLEHYPSIEITKDELL